MTLTLNLLDNCKLDHEKVVLKIGEKVYPMMRVGRRPPFGPSRSIIIKKDQKNLTIKFKEQLRYICV